VGFRGAIVGVSPHCFRDPAAACPGENRLIFNILSAAAHTTTTNNCPPRKLKAMRGRAGAHKQRCGALMVQSKIGKRHPRSQLAALTNAPADLRVGQQRGKPKTEPAGHCQHRCHVEHREYLAPGHSRDYSSLLAFRRSIGIEAGAACSSPPRSPAMRFFRAICSTRFFARSSHVRRCNPGLLRHMGTPRSAGRRAAGSGSRPGDEYFSPQRREQHLRIGGRSHQPDLAAVCGARRENTGRKRGERWACPDSEQPVLARRGAVRPPQ
jgi:hypothetical protein